jgi:hypothetical protein
MPHQSIKYAIIVTLTVLTLQSVARAEFHGHPDLAAKATQIKRISILPTQIQLYEIGAGGSLEKMDDWSKTANGNIRQALINEFAKREQLSVTDFDEDSLPADLRSSYDETLLLYDAVSNAILTHTFKWQYGPPAAQAPFFPEKAREFRYSLGEAVADLPSGSDVLLLVRGFDQRSSGGRKALNVATGIIGAALGVVAVPRGGDNMFTATLVDAKTGDILWFSHSLKPYDLRNLAEAQQLAVEFMIDLPTLGQTP